MRGAAEAPMPETYDTLIPALKEMLPARTLGLLGRTVAFIRRLRELRAGMFLWAVVLSRFSQGWPGFEEARRWYQRLSGKLLAPRPFHLRFKSPAAVEFFARAFDQIVARWRTPSTPGARHPIAKFFPDVVLWDSTIMQVADELKKVFPGLRGIAAGVKVSLAVSLYGLVPLYATIVAATLNDMKLFPPLKLFRAGTLLLFDRGFVAYERLRDIASAGCCYICRHRSDGNALIVGAHRAPAYVRRALRRHPEGVWLRDVLPCGKKITKSWDLDVLLRPNRDRSHKVPARLAILPGPKGAQRPYLTNLSRRLWTGRALAELYRLRWQIELVFKELKQHLSLDRLPTRDPHAVQVLLWGSLIALALSRAVASCFYPVQHLIGLEAALRPPLLTRALQASIRILGRALVAPPHEVRTLVTVFVDQLLADATNVRTAREDSLMRLRPLFPRRALA
jgi:Transposase DDE domain